MILTENAVKYMKNAVDGTKSLCQSYLDAKTWTVTMHIALFFKLLDRMPAVRVIAIVVWNFTIIKKVKIQECKIVVAGWR